jgi:AcrR family transcriptional regulator
VFSPRRTRREEILEQAALLFAASGFAGVTVDDIGAACGISGPALYHHFAGKEAVLGEMLVSISEHLVAMGTDISNRGGDAAATLGLLVDAHAEFAATRPELITVQTRDLVYAPEDDQRTVRRLQRRYVERWVDVLGDVRPELDVAERRATVHAVFGLLNSSPYVPGMSPAALVDLFAELGRRTLQVSGAGRPNR